MGVVYLDHGATAWPSKYHSQDAANASSSHVLGERAAQRLQHAEERALRLLKAQTGRIIFTSGGTESNNLILQGGAWDVIISTETEHLAVMHTLLYIGNSNQGSKIIFLPVDATGRIDLADLQRHLRLTSGKRVLVSLMYVNNEIGTRHDIGAIGKITKAAGAMFHTDAVQAPGHECIDIDRDSVDFLSLSAHKFYGPLGVGLLYCRQEDEIKNPLLHGGSQQRSIRPGTEPVTAIEGMVEALQAATGRCETARRGLGAARDRLAAELVPYIIQGLVLPTGHPTERAPHHLSFCLHKTERGLFQKIMQDEYGVLCSGGSACSSSSPVPSHVLSALMVPGDYIDGTVRIVVGHTNTDSEIDHACRALRATLSVIFPDS